MNRLIRAQVAQGVAYAAILLIAAYVLALALGWSLMLREQSATSILDMLNGTGERPFIYRALVPQLANAIVAVTPSAVADHLASFALAMKQSPLFIHFIDLVGWKDFSPRLADSKNLYPVLVVIALLYTALVVYALTLQRLSDAFFPGHACVAWGTALLGLLALPPVLDGNTKVYDFPVLMFMALALLYLYRQQWGRYSIVFILGCLNKETMILMTGLFALHYWPRMTRARFFKLLFLQCFIFIDALAVVHYAFSDNPGSDFFLRGLEIVAKEFQPYDGYGYHAMGLLFLGGLLIGRWPEVPLLLRLSLLLLAADVLIYYVLGMHREFRVFFDAFPALTVIAGYTLLKPLDEKPAGL